MQEPYLILSISLVAVMIATALVSVKLFKSQRHYRNRNIGPAKISTYPTVGVFTSPSPQPDSLNAAVDTPSSPESSMPPVQLDNEEASISPNVIPPPADITVATVVENEIESKENKPETVNGNVGEKAQERITEITAIIPIETSSDMPLTTDNGEAGEEITEDKDHEEKELLLPPATPKPILPIVRIDSPKEPIKERGDFRGAPIGHREKIPKQSLNTEEAYRRLKPEIVCWRREGKWIIGIEIPSDHFSEDPQEVRQGAKEMQREESRDQCWRLESLTDPLEVTWGNENNRNIDQVLINAEPYGIFKLTGSDQAKGSLVKRISYGAYLLVVPPAWSFEKGMTDQDIVEESISIEKVKAYYCKFEQGREGRFTFVDESGRSWPFEAKPPLFELVGTTLEDAIDDMGVLFGNAPPSVKIKGHRSWKEIACVVVIQQGINTGEARFKDKIIPPEDVTQLSLGDNLKAQNSGWYLLRFYDNKQDSPIERLDFRFVSAISGIKIHRNSVLPARSGHQIVTVEIEHKLNFRISPTSPPNNSLQIKQGVNSTTIVIPPNPEADESGWFLGTDNGQCVRATFLAERIWWSITDEDKEPTEWHDKPIALRREDFKPTSHKALWIQLPTSGWTERIHVDFSLSQPRRFPIKLNQRVVKILLDNFYDSRALFDKDVAHDLFIQVQKDNQNLSAIVANLSAEKAHVEEPIQQSPQTIDARAACKGGRVFYGNCRHCSAMLKEKNYGSH